MRRCLFALGAAVLLYGVELMVRVQGGELRLSVSRLGILEGRALERLQNGNSVPFDFQLQAIDAGRRHLMRSTAARFVFSYDLWEEKFAVARVSGTRRFTSHLTAAAAEAWCLEQISFRTSEFPRGASVRLRLEIRAEDAPADRAASESGISLTDLIDIFSRTARPSQQKWTLESGIVRIDAAGAGPG